MTDPDDRKLEALFRELRETDEARAPTFAVAASKPARGWLFALGGLTAAGIVVAVMLLAQPAPVDWRAEVQLTSIVDRPVRIEHDPYGLRIDEVLAANRGAAQ